MLGAPDLGVPRIGLRAARRGAKCTYGGRPPAFFVMSFTMVSKRSTAWASCMSSSSLSLMSKVRVGWLAFTKTVDSVWLPENTSRKPRWVGAGDELRPDKLRRFPGAPSSSEQASTFAGHDELRPRSMVMGLAHSDVVEVGGQTEVIEKRV